MNNCEYEFDDNNKDYKPLQQEMNCITYLYNKVSYISGNLISCLCIPFLCCGPIVEIEQGYVGILTRYGIFKKVLTPGRYNYNIFTDKISLISMKTQTLNISSQQVMTSDNLSVTIDAVCFFNIIDAVKCKFNVEEFYISIDSLCKTTLRTIIGENDLNTLFSKRSVINKRVTELIENHTKHWGANIISIEIKDVSLPDDLKRSMAQISEAKMQAQAKLIYAEADSKSVNILKDASKELEKCPDALKLIWFNTLKEISKEKSNTIVVSESISLQNLCTKY